MNKKEILEEGYTFCSNHLVKYPDCNSTQNLFGGKLLAWIDEKAAIFASKYMHENLVVTAHFGGLDFETPAQLRKIVKIYARVLNEGTTSIRIGVLVTKSNMGEDKEELIAKNEVVFVAVNEDGRPKPWKNTNN
jgi:acyl-CoA hydrolase